MDFCFLFTEQFKFFIYFCSGECTELHQGLSLAHTNSNRNGEPKGYVLVSHFETCQWRFPFSVMSQTACAVDSARVCVVVEHPAIGSNRTLTHHLGYRTRTLSSNFVFKHVFLFPRDSYTLFPEINKNRLWGSKQFFVESVAGTPTKEKQAGREPDRFLLSSSEVKNAQNRISFSTGFYDAMLNYPQGLFHPRHYYESTIQNICF